MMNTATLKINEMLIPVVISNTYTNDVGKVTDCLVACFDDFVMNGITFTGRTSMIVPVDMIEES